MLKSVVTLINSDKSHKIGNHSKEVKGNITEYSYHLHVIAVQNDNDKTMFFPYVGLYCDNVSTKQAINSYKEGLAEKGYTEITAPYSTY